jgi:hypothetical protein
MTARWALGYAERLGWRVLPCWPGTKRAILPHTSASNDPEQVEAWVEERGYNLGWAVATGPGSGIVVLDVENAEGERELVELERKHGALPDLFPMVWSGGGSGWHGYFAWPRGRELKNRRLGEKVEPRGDKLLLMLPPSIHPDTGQRYRWADDRTPDMGMPELTEAWLKLLEPEPVPQGPSVHREAQGSSRYALRALESELDRTAAARSGNRNHQLNASAHALFRFCPEGLLPANLVHDGLMDAARHAGLSDFEAKSTIRSAARARGVRI